jgi:uncharacterized protein (TIGR03435 family)
VIDVTALDGTYDFDLEWTPDVLPVPEPEPNTALPPVPGPSIFKALEEQLGLKLVAQKGPVEMLIIEHVEKPSEN